MYPVSAPSAPRLFTEMRIGLRAEAWSQPPEPGYPMLSVAQPRSLRIPRLRQLPGFSSLSSASHCQEPNLELDLLHTGQPVNVMFMHVNGGILPSPTLGSYTEPT